jgi:hypothetical protein
MFEFVNFLTKHTARNRRPLSLCTLPTSCRVKRAETFVRILKFNYKNQWKIMSIVVYFTTWQHKKEQTRIYMERQMEIMQRWPKMDVEYDSLNINCHQVPSRSKPISMKNIFLLSKFVFSQYDQPTRQKSLLLNERHVELRALKGIFCWDTKFSLGSFGRFLFRRMIH